MTEFARACLLVLAAYGALGLLFALAFHWRGLAALDSGAHGAGFGFRLLVTPGVIVLWPLLAWRWARARQGGSFPGGPEAPVSPRRLRATHALAWKALVVLMPVMVGAALWWRPAEAQSSKLKIQILEQRTSPIAKPPL